MVDIISVIEKYWALSEGKAKASHWPSELTDCRRKLWYKWTGEAPSEPIEATGNWKMKMGNAIHSVVQATLHEIEKSKDRDAVAWPGFTMLEEVPTGYVPVQDLKFPMSGRLDVVFTEDDGSMSGLEVKSTYGEGTRMTKRDGPKDSAVWQAIAYIVLARIAKLNGEAFIEGDLQRVYIMYLSRDDGDRAMYVVQWNVNDGSFDILRLFQSGDYEHLFTMTWEDWEAGLDRLRDVEKAVEANTEPNRDFIVAIKNGEMRLAGFQKDNVKYRGDWQCSYCQFRSRCWSEKVKEYTEGDNAEEIAARRKE